MNRIGGSIRNPLRVPVVNILAADPDQVLSKCLWPRTAKFMSAPTISSPFMDSSENTSS